MIRPVRFHPDAIADAQGAWSWYRDRSPRAAGAFLEMLAKAIDEIATAPRSGPTYLSGSRRHVLRRFPFVIVYRVDEEKEVEILAVAHGRRRPGFWKDRLR